MTKVPVAGAVKTRLQTVLSPDECAALSAAFLLDAVKKAESIGGKTIIAFSPFVQRDRLENILPNRYLLVEQKGADLGEKMFTAFELAFAQKADSVVMIGTDSPTFSPDYIEQAFEFLELNSDAVLGKTEDGGFYLIGLRRLDPRIFQNVKWSSAGVFEQVRENIMNLEWHLREVPSWYDVDVPDDLRQLKEELLHSENARKRAPNTFECLKKLSF
jgi:hypothetical protein